MTDAHALAAWLEQHRARLRAFVAAEAKSLLRFESEDDLVQGVHAHALRVAERLEWRGEREFLHWLFTLARQHLTDRRRHWFALRRDGGSVLRLTASPRSADDRDRVAHPRAANTGPATFAQKREQLALAAKALAVLSERDRRLVQSFSEDAPIADLAREWNASEEAVKKARQRAVDRFRATYALLEKSRGA
ncbi:MAG: sigma-70 family RNA polymerase sigma factor [Planctomycetes bacterium]|nr:sigma-70 family RNA polymerase sigma factor [Planctomycetota bacterium]